MTKAEAQLTEATGAAVAAMKQFYVAIRNAYDEAILDMDAKAGRAATNAWLMDRVREAYSRTHDSPGSRSKIEADVLVQFLPSKLQRRLFNDASGTGTFGED